MKFLAICFWVLVLSLAASGITSDKALEGWKVNYSSLIESLEIEYTETLVEAKAKYPKHVENLYYSIGVDRVQLGSRFREVLLFTKNQGDEPERQEDSFDGIEYRQLKPANTRGKFIGVISPIVEKESSGYEEPYTAYLLASGTPENERITTAEAFFTASAKDSNNVLTSSGAEIVNGITCECFRLIRNGKLKKEMWVAPDKGMLPVQYISYYGADTRYQMSVLEIDECNGIFYPKKARKGVYNPSKTIVLEVQVSKFIPNPTVDPNIFRLDFPTGTTVVDRRIGESYVVGVEQ
jgi:hypothetical protein